MPSYALNARCWWSELQLLVLVFFLKPLRWECISATLRKIGQLTLGHNDPCCALSTDISLRQYQQAVGHVKVHILKVHS